jgi:hypothetical protein
MTEFRKSIEEQIKKLERIEAVIKENIRAGGIETHYERKHHREYYLGKLQAYKLVLTKSK